ncbi:MAG: hypothetical protein KAY24_02585 [Candidatus Eisenbacteria sp.]|nr:hypothetical protein [Candidatus Eisenbacteria bacterium]
MRSSLSQSDRKYLDDLLTWDSSRRRLDSLLYNMALVAGGALIVCAAIITVGRLNDRTVLSVLVPGFVSGLFLVGLYFFGEKRLRERHRLAEILRKIGGAI